MSKIYMSSFYKYDVNRTNCFVSGTGQRIHV